MSRTTGEKLGVIRGPRLQVGVSAMAVWVLGMAVYFAIVRGARGFWIGRGTTIKMPLLDIDRVVVIFLLAPATLIAAWLVADATRLVRPRRTAFGLAWRVAGVAFIVGVSAYLSALLRDDRDALVRTIFDRPQWRLKLATLALAIGTIGLLLGLVTPKGPRRGRPSPRRRWAVASVVVVGLAGVGLAAYWRDILIPYLVLVAIDAVSHSLHRPALMTDWAVIGHAVDPILRDPARWTSLDARIVRAGLDGAAGLVSCGLAAIWLGRDLRRSSEVSETRSPSGTAYRGLTAVAAWGMGAYLILVSLPRLHPSLAEGVGLILEPGWGLAVVASLLGLAAGLVARGVGGVDAVGEVAVPIPVEGRRLSLAWTPGLVVGLFKLAVAVVLVELILMAVTQIRGGDTLPWYAPHPLSSWLAAAGGVFTFAGPNAVYFDAGETPEAFFLFIAAIIFAALAFRFLVAGRGEAPADRIGRDRRRIGRFVASWLALTGVMLTLLPAFFLAGFAVLHLTMRAAFP